MSHNRPRTTAAKHSTDTTQLWQQRCLELARAAKLLCDRLSEHRYTTPQTGLVRLLSEAALIGSESDDDQQPF